MCDVIGEGGPAPRARCPDQSCAVDMRRVARSLADADGADGAAAVELHTVFGVWPLALLVAATQLLCIQPPVRAQEHLSRCTATHWTSPTWAVPPQPLLAALRYPDLAIGPSAIFVVGVRGLEAIYPGLVPDRRDGAWPPEMDVFTTGRTVAAIPRPRGGRWYFYPRAAYTDDGVIHLVWGEADDAPPADPSSISRNVAVTHLLYARLRAGRWSAPTVIYRSSRIDWEVADISRLVATEDGQLHLALTAIDSAGRGVLVHLRHADGAGAKWDVTTWADESPAYADIAVGTGRTSGEAAIVYVGSGNVQSGTSSGNGAVLLRLSSDGGETWGPPRQIAQPGEVPAFEPRVLLARDGALHVLWRQDASASVMSAGRMWHAASRDNGASWYGRTSVALPQVPMRARAVVDFCGVVHLVTESHGEGAVHLVYAQWRNGAWTAPVVLFQGTSSTHPALALGCDGTVYLAWDRMERRSPDATPWSGVMYSALEASARKDSRGDAGTASGKCRL